MIKKIITLIIIIIVLVLIVDSLTTKYLFNFENFQAQTTQAQTTQAQTTQAQTTQAQTKQAQTTQSQAQIKAKAEAQAKLNKDISKYINKKKTLSEETKSNFEYCNEYLIEERDMKKIDTYNICKDYIGNCNIENKTITHNVVDINKLFNDKLSGKMNKELNEKIDDKIKSLLDIEKSNVEKQEKTVQVLTELESIKSDLIDSIYEQELYKNDYHDNIKSILINQQQQNEDNIKSNIINNKVKQIQGLISLINKQNNKEEKILSLVNLFNEYIIINVRVVSRYYDKSTNKLLDLHEVIKRQGNDLNDLQNGPNSMYNSNNSNDYYNILYEDNILYYEPRNIDDGLPCLVNGQIKEGHCEKFPNNKDISWHMKLTNGYDSPDNVDSNLIKNQLKEETSNSVIYNMDYSRNIESQGGYFRIIKISSIDEFNLRFGIQSSDFVKIDDPIYVCVPALRGIENNKIKKMLVYNEENLVVLDVNLENISKKAFWKLS